MWPAPYVVGPLPSGRQRTSRMRISGRLMFSANQAVLTSSSGRVSPVTSAASGRRGDGASSVSYGGGCAVHARRREARRGACRPAGRGGGDLPERRIGGTAAGGDGQGHGRPRGVGGADRPRQHRLL